MFVTVCAIIVGAMVRRIRPHDLLDIGDLASWIGIAAVVMGLLLRTWAAAVLEKGSVLATQGPYQICRHPLYVGSFLVVLGYCTLLGDWLSATALFTAVLLTYPFAIIREEERMLAAFGDDWKHHSRKTFRFLPGEFPRSWGPISLAKWLRNREYKALLTGLGGLCLIEFWRWLSW